ncbi:MAG: hypothetical protein Q8T08_00575, partial [Ignavibacteria bacterium]|nr:hypothetical protein [Ignavibacteria bacterium]
MIDIYIEAIYWNIDEDELQLKQMEGLNSISTGKVESTNYFTASEFRKLQGIDDVNPMFIIDDYIKKFDTGNVLQLRFLADYMRKPVEQVVSLLLRLASKGFLIYDADAEIAYINDRFKAVLGAKAGKLDYDVIQINTTTAKKQANLLLNLKSFDLKMSGIEEVILSETQGVQIFPDRKEIIMKKNRDFVFSGLIKAGLFDFYARDAAFEYDPFKLNFSFVDSLSFVVKLREQPKNATKIEYIRVKNVLADLTGTLYIDEPANKSGKKNIAHFPVFSSKSECYVYYEKPDIQQGALKKDDFFYVIDPFEIDSLDNFSTDNLRFSGYLTSAEIFPVFREPLVVMKDYSLGFDHNLPKEGYEMFTDKAHYFNTIHLSNAGFQGLGQLDYQTGTAFSKQFIFYPDSVLALLDRFDMREREQSVEFPQGFADQIDFEWKVDSNIVTLTTISNPYHVFTDANFSGKINISPNGMIGAGTLEFGKAQVKSNDYSFLSRAFHADTADFRLFPDQG